MTSLFVCAPFLDINECLTTDSCDQICKNIPNSFECSCVAGYELVNRTICKAINSKFQMIHFFNAFILEVLFCTVFYHCRHDDSYEIN